MAFVRTTFSGNPKYNKLAKAAKAAKKFDAKETMKRCKVKDSKELHKLKKDLFKEFKDEMGPNKNADLLFDKAGRLVLKGNKDGRLIPTNITF